MTNTPLFKGWIRTYAIALLLAACSTGSQTPTATERVEEELMTPTATVSAGEELP